MITPEEAEEAQHEAIYAAWLLERPEKVRVVAERFKPWKMYRFKSTGQQCTVLSFGEPIEADSERPVTLTVHAYSQLSELLDTQVFGVDPDDLELEE